MNTTQHNTIRYNTIYGIFPDIDECAADSTLCGTGGTCINIKDGGGYECKCDSGYELKNKKCQGKIKW